MTYFTTWLFRAAAVLTIYTSEPMPYVCFQSGSIEPIVVDEGSVYELFGVMSFHDAMGLLNDVCTERPQVKLLVFGSIDREEQEMGLFSLGRERAEHVRNYLVEEFGATYMIEIHASESDFCIANPEAAGHLVSIEKSGRGTDTEETAVYQTLCRSVTFEIHKSGE